MKTLIKDCCIIKMTNENEIIKKGYILIEEDKISKIGEGEYKDLKDEKLNIIDGEGTAAIPGLINTHTHCSMTLLRGYGEGLPLMKWLNEKIWPFEAKLDAEDIYIGAELAALEMIKSGTTCFLDMYYFEDDICKAVGQSGIRGIICTPVIGDDWQQRIERFKAFYKRNNGSFDGRIINMLAPHAPYTCTRESLEQSAKAAKEMNCGLHIHIAETLDEVETINKTYGCSPVEFLEQTGIFENKVIAAHCVHISDKDMEILKKYNVTAAHCPQSNMKLSSGISPVSKMLALGINVSLGTDGASSNNNLDMIEEMQTASYLQKLSTSDATALSPYETLEMATVNGAKALGLEKEIGKLDVGMKADIVLIDLNKPHMVPIFDVCANIVYSGSGKDVKTVIVNGKTVMEDYVVKTMNEKDILNSVKKSVENILSRQ
ncbi:5-methylthioadenosine/S-adenosylhomocysteine deaminase [Oxobacter pfennigii]|uniref:5-methylthioadenosine/S-adenosylhomocysteine deaminase n=1 Tax=Oxobacter pfennigii TaxID=36849 RepID=A0A0P8WAN4_9CLOT|nr:amidohydrolase [Oxobacter pfennigii]KPU45013.1 5-methylthioadenosine/S-adenosylhomocysteine deaminase [Oxobacter pfennigii]